MNAPPNLTKIEQLRARDGDKCWLCGGRLAFNAEPNSKKAPTKEHLDALSNGGGDTLDNLVLCHPGCNKHLANRPKADKLKMREKQIANRGKQAVPAKAVPKAVPVKPTAIKARAAASPPETPAPDWQRMAMIATASATFFAGLCLGLLVR